MPRALVESLGRPTDLNAVEISDLNLKVNNAIKAVNPCTACTRTQKNATSMTFSRQQYVNTKVKNKDIHAQAVEHVLAMQVGKKLMKKRSSTGMDVEKERSEGSPLNVYVN